MKLKEMWKRFWTLDIHNHEGFTLVELIIVIAILAILSTGAIAGYSAYVTSANRTVDESLATEIENVMILAYYNGTLKPGASIVVYYGKAGDETYNVVVDPNGDMGAAAALIAAYGENYATSLRLSWEGWKDEMGSYPTADEIANVQGSNFKTENMGAMLSQVQNVVNSAANYFVGAGIADENVKHYLENAGLSGETVTDPNAAANATVFMVADNLSKVGPDSEGINTTQFVKRWKAGKLNEYTEWDKPTREAAQYAMVYAAATYIDTLPGSTTTYRQQMEGDHTNILSKCRAVLDAMDDTDEYKAYKSSGQMEMDAKAFLTYMEGVSASADTLTTSTDLTSQNYFNNDTVLNYVNDYVSLNNVLSSVDMKNGAFVFYFNGESVSCLPLNY